MAKKKNKTDKNNNDTETIIGILLNPEYPDKPVCIAMKRGKSTLAIRFSCFDADSFCDALKAAIVDARSLGVENDTHH